MEVDANFHPTIIGRRGVTVTEIRKKHDVNIQFPDRSDENQVSESITQSLRFCSCPMSPVSNVNSSWQNLIKIIGYEKNTEAARQHIQGMVSELESHVSQDVHIDRRVHSRLIGAKGRAIKKIMDDYEVRWSGNVLLNADYMNIVLGFDHLVGLIMGWQLTQVSFGRMNSGIQKIVLEHFVCVFAVPNGVIHYLLWWCCMPGVRDNDLRSPQNKIWEQAATTFPLSESSANKLHVSMSYFFFNLLFLL